MFTNTRDGRKKALPSPIKRHFLTIFRDPAQMPSHDARTKNCDPRQDPSTRELEEARLATLDRLGLFDTPPEREFDAIVELAKKITGCSVAVISLVGKERQWFKAKSGIELDGTPRDLAFCAWTIAIDDVLIVPDANSDPRFSENLLVTGAPHIRFYAGVPIHAELLDDPSQKVAVGSLCVIDDKPGDLDPHQLALLIELAHLVESLIAAKSSASAAVRFAGERGRHLEELNRRNRQLRQAERMASIGSWRLTLADNQTEWSEQTYAIHGVPVGDGQPLDSALDFFPAKARVTITNALERTMQTGEPFDVETDFNTAQGEYRRVRSMGELELVDGQPIALIGVFQDVTARFTMEKALRDAAYTDDLTRIASRGSFTEFVDDKIKANLAAGERSALLLIDLDHFKAVNDRFGHHAGDEVLRAMAKRLQAEYLGDSFAARLGGDEFVLVISDQALLSDLPGLLRQLLADLQHSVSSNGLTLGVSATIGACWLSKAITDRGELLRNADAALYEAKRHQRGSAMIAGETEVILPRRHAAPTFMVVKG